MEAWCGQEAFPGKTEVSLGKWAIVVGTSASLPDTIHISCPLSPSARFRSLAHFIDEVTEVQSRN